MNAPSAYNPISALAERILDAFEDCDQLTAADLAKRLGRQHAPHALLAALVAAGALRHDGDGYRLGGAS